MYDNELSEGIKGQKCICYIDNEINRFNNKNAPAGYHQATTANNFNPAPSNKFYELNISY